MNDATKKVLAETWTASLGSQASEHLSAVFCDGEYFAHISGDTMGIEHARTTIAACAPEALRLLADLEWVSSEDAYGQGYGPAECAFCEVKAGGGVAPCGIHKSDCKWLLLMQKAGLR